MRINYGKDHPKAIKGLAEIEAFVNHSTMDPKLHELVKVRASQLNGCAFCLDMHTKDARANGETEQRLYGLSAWRETSYYTDKERAALEWTEALTLISQTHISDELYLYVREYFDERELMELTMAVIAINSWNRLAISFKKEPGSYQHENSKK